VRDRIPKNAWKIFFLKKEHPQSVTTTTATATTTTIWCNNSNSCMPQQG